MRQNGGKDQKRERNRSSSSEHEKERERSRQKKNKVEYYMSPDLHLTKHFYFVTNKQKNIGYPFAVWNFCIIYGRKPAICLIVCESQSQIHQILQFKKLNRKVAILADHDRQSVKKLIQTNQIEVLLMTNKKASILSGLEQACPCFSLIVNVGFHKDVENYRKLHEFLLKTGGIIVSFIDHRRDIERLQRQVTINFNQIDGNVSEDEINKQIVGEIQFLPQSKPQTISLLKMLPFSSQQISARLFELLYKEYTNIEKSKHLSLIGYITYQVKTDVQFNSYKFIWNYLKDMPQSVSENVRNMVKFKNRKGVVFNVPLQLRYEMDHYIRKVRKHNRDNNKYEISIVYQMPEIEDTTSQEYKEVQQKKNFAMKHKQELQIFVGGLPYKATQEQIRSFFLENNVNPLTIRIMRNKQGESKGICFMLCQDEEHVKRCLKLDEAKFGDRAIRVHMADKKQKRRND